MNIISKIRNVLHNNVKDIYNNVNEHTEYVAESARLLNLSLECKKSGIDTSPIEGCTELIVSLTTYGKRLFQVHLTIESLLQQTVKPNRIILWLGCDLRQETLPIVLRNQMCRGLEIKYCKDIKSYKKIIPTLHEYPGATIITVDDDALYPFDFIENLIVEHQKFPTGVIANKVRHIEMVDSTILPYSNWMPVTNGKDSKRNIAIGVGGVLYPPNCFDDRVMDEKTFMSLAPSADDLWLKVMELLKGTVVKCSSRRSRYELCNRDVQDMALANFNQVEGGNDIYIRKLSDRYNLQYLLQEG